MTAWSLRQENDARNHRRGYYGGGHWPAKCQPAVIHRFVEEVAQGRPKWSRENERSPEQCDPGHICPKVECSRNCQSRAEDERASFIPESAGIGDPVAERGSECL